ncbi:hypothetical protein NGRA_2468 [Nosema granulosis]|uniref:Uncharacterized protein n=1 Tax=Nosema granulosis TaxID=83296 RepID=A0A9P6GWL5_9MICR|nr:hypothetical protein NGRA_2468 [Nosema granulosis]
MKRNQTSKVIKTKLMNVYYIQDVPRAEYVVENDFCAVDRKINVIYNKKGRISSYNVSFNNWEDASSKSVELNSTEAEAVDFLSSLCTGKKEIDWDLPLEIPRIKYSAFKLPPTKEAEGYLRCTSCKKSVAYKKIANIIFASKLGDFDSLFKKTTKNLEAERDCKRKKKEKFKTRRKVWSRGNLGGNQMKLFL